MHSLLIIFAIWQRLKVISFYTSFLEKAPKLRKHVFLRTMVLFAILMLTVLFSNSSPGRFYGTVQAFPGPDPAWKQNYGNFLTDERAYSAVQTSDGGYMLAGTIYSSPYPPTGYHALLVKTDSAGNKQWDMTYAGGGNDEDYVRSVVQTSDGGYVFAGYTRGPPYPSLNFYSWLVKTDSAGNAVWNKIFTSLGQNYVYSMVKTSDGGFALAGKGPPTPSDTYYEAMLVKTDSSGNILWSKTYGGSGDFANSVIQTSDGGYLLAGSGLWKTNSAGNLQWTKPLDDPEAIEAKSIIQTSDGGYVYVGDKRSLHVGNDILMVKTDSSGNSEVGKNSWRI